MVALAGGLWATRHSFAFNNARESETFPCIFSRHSVDFLVGVRRRMAVGPDSMGEVESVMDELGK